MLESQTGAGRESQADSTLDMGTTLPIAITGWVQSGMQYSTTLSVPRQGDHNELLAKVAKRAERAQLLVIIMSHIIIQVCSLDDSLVFFMSALSEDEYSLLLQLFDRYEKCELKIKGYIERQS